MSRISQQQLESYLWGAATLLRGTIDAGDYKQFIFPLLFYKRLCDVYDEETRNALAESDGDKEFASYPENHRFQIPPEAQWNETRKVAKNVGAALQNALRAIETANPDKLYGIFGDAQWTNKDRLPDAMLRDLIEHFSSLELTIANLPEDELGNGYEYLIKKFADDSGHTAAEFYTNRTVVHLMTELLQPQPGESVYDPTCGSGGMPLSCIAHLRQQGKEWRNVRIYGQERNLMTSSIARMNCFLHGIEDFKIERGDTLAEPKFVQRDRLQQFDVVLANPPYSIKQWDREAFASDPWGRNIFGTPPQGRADYAFWQHIIQSMNPQTGRCAILFPHGVLFRQEESEMRRRLIEADLIECVIGLGPNLFYNSPMQSCVVVCRANKPMERRGKILFIDAVDEVTRKRAQSFLTDMHIEHIVAAYQAFQEVPNLARTANIEEIRRNNYILNIPLYVRNAHSVADNISGNLASLKDAFEAWCSSAFEVRQSISQIDENRGTGAPPLNISSLIIRFPAWIDRSKWHTVSLGEVVEEISERVDDPTTSGVERFVGLEHFDAGELKIRRWGTTENLISAMKRFSAGDTLFARRNAYLKRASMVDFDGLCSGDAIVLREKEGQMVPGFLPLLLNTESFWNFAIANAAGTMSRRVNVKTLLQYKLELPPLDQQFRIAEIIWTLDDLKEIWYITLTKLMHASDAFAVSSFKDVTVAGSNNNATTRKLGDIFHVRAGSTPSRGNPEYWHGDILWVKTGEVNYDDIYDTEEKITILGFEKSAVTIYPKDSILIALYGQGPTLGRVAQLRVEATSNQACAAIFPTEGYNMRFLYHYLRSQYSNIRRQARGASQPNISGQIVKDFIVPAPPLEEQNNIANALDDFRRTQNEIRTHIDDCDALISSLIGELLP